jgi:hypothetical protein
MITLTSQPYKLLPIYDRIINYVLKHVIPLAFGYGPDPHNYIFNSGTATLINLGCGPLALTCEHVTTPFNEFRKINKDKINAELFIGGARGLDRRIIACDEALDLATIQLTQHDLSTIPSGQNVCGTQFINKIYNGQIKKDDVIVFAGFPSEPSWRYINDINNLHAFHSCVFFAKAVSINEDYIICQSIDTNYDSKNSNNNSLINDPTGMSGGAAFLICDNGFNLTCRFIGIISSGKFMTQNCLITYIRLLKRLNSDGTIKEVVT